MECATINPASGERTDPGIVTITDSVQGHTEDASLPLSFQVWAYMISKRKTQQMAKLTDDDDSRKPSNDFDIYSKGFWQRRTDIQIFFRN